jgi:ATP phosphoribosyltransferase
MTAPFSQAELAPDQLSPLVLALPKGRILAECGPFLARAGIEPATDFTDEDSRRLAWRAFL